MAFRILLAALAGFWLVMNVLLYQREFGTGGSGNRIPVERVWQRILESPDNSALQIFRGAEKIGSCRWRPTVVEPDGPAPVEGLVESTLGYRIEADGMFALDAKPSRIRFEARFDFDPDRAWTSFEVRIRRGDLTSIFTGDRAAGRFKVDIGDGPEGWSRVFDLDEIRDPGRLVREIAPDFAALLPTLPDRDPASTETPGWEGYNDRIRFRGADIRIHRLQLRLWDRETITVEVSRAGEILRARFPGNISLRNDASVVL